MSLLQQACETFKTNGAFLVREAFHFHERRCSASGMRKTYERIVVKHPDGRHEIVGEVPDFIEDYCLVLLANKCSPLKLQIMGRV
jgi:hypothetical protein